MNHTIYQLADVFKQTGFPEYTYAVREEYDVIFRNSLLDGGALIYLYGDSKSGKSSMWKKYIGNDECLEIKITENMTIHDFYADLMCKVEPFIETQFETIDGNESSVSIGGEGGIKSFLSASGGAENKDSNVKTIKYERVANPGLSLTTVTDAVSNIDKTVILEDFQVASDDFVKGMASILKAFADNTIRVIIVGIDNRVPVLVKEREDIAGRITTINLSHFKKEELKSIIQQGEDRLNIEFNEEIIDFLVEESLERAYILQGLCRLICSLQNITKTCKNKQRIDDLEEAKRACKFFATAHQAVYEPTARNIAQAATKKNKHDTYRWLLTVLKNDIKVGTEGVPAMIIATKIKEHDPSFPVASIYPCLKTIPKKQTTNVFRYENIKLYVDDKLFLFYLKWAESLNDIFEGLSSM